MKFEPQTAFPYPVLRPYSDDYVDADFQAIIDFIIGKEENVVIAKASFAISSKAIINEIKKGNAAFFVVFGCRNTYFRQSVATEKNLVEVKLSTHNLRGELRVEPYVVAKKAINDYKNNEVNPEFGDASISFQIGNILAQDDHQIYYIDKDVFKPLTSVFDLVKRESISGAEWNLEFEQDHVHIAVSPEMKERIDNARNSIANKAVLINSIYFAAAMQAIQMLKEGGDQFDDYQWAKVIKGKCHNFGIDIMNNPAYYSAERLMKLPLSLLDTYVFKGDQ